MTSEELFNQSIKPMSNRQQTEVGVIASGFIKDKILNREGAVTFLGMKYNEGTIIGITSSPGLSYPQGVYITVSYFNKPSEHIRVGE